MAGRPRCTAATPSPEQRFSGQNKVTTPTVAIAACPATLLPPPLLPLLLLRPLYLLHKGQLENLSIGVLRCPEERRGSLYAGNGNGCMQAAVKVNMQATAKGDNKSCTEEMPRSQPCTHVCCHSISNTTDRLADFISNDC